MSRFFVAPECIGADMIHMEDRGDLHHMMKVLRLQPGDEVDISDGNEWEYRAEILSLDKTCAELKILDKQKCATEPSVRVTLYQGIPKQGKMETIIQKCVELGVHRIAPVFMDRTVVVDKGNFSKKIERWQKVAAESVKQCRRGMIPEISEAVRMPQVLKELQHAAPDRMKTAVLAGPAEEITKAAVLAGPAESMDAGSAGRYDLVLLPYENEDGTTIKDVLREHAADAPRSIAVLIGPEGGFSDAEVASITAAGGHSVTLGRTTLRTETAGMAAIAMIMYELEL